MTKKKGFGLKGLKASKTKYRYDKVDAKLLESFDNPFADRKKNKNGVSGVIHIEAPEFTCLCPITGQPDYGAIMVDYEPDKKCLESKSFKLYLIGFRMEGVFHEALVNRIANDLVELLSPRWLKVEGRFNARGGISFHPTAVWRGHSEGAS